MKRIYVCTPLKSGKFDLPLIVKTLPEDVFAYIPPTDPTKPKIEGALLNRKMIDLCDEVWVFGPLGRDCSWEIGYAEGLGKKIIVHINNNNQDVLNDWMLWTSKNLEKKEV
jgi:nucleoside 2-deoxyribosyltransferase